MTKLRSMALVIFCQAVLTSLALGQVTGENDRVNEYWVPGRPAITIYVMGDVTVPGVWKIRQDVDFVELLSVVGIGSLSRPTSTGLVNETTLRIRRNVGGTRAIAFEAPLETVLAGETTTPSLSEGDILLVQTEQKTKRRLTVRTLASVVGAASSLVLLYIRIAGL